jgi:hypothetical protein
MTISSKLSASYQHLLAYIRLLRIRKLAQQQELEYEERAELLYTADPEE